MARKKRTRRRKKPTVPLAPIIGLVAGMSAKPTGYGDSPVGYFLVGNFQDGIRALSRNYIGFETSTGTFDIGSIQKGLLPLAIGGLVHKFVGGAPLNLNKQLAAAGVPYIRI